MFIEIGQYLAQVASFGAHLLRAANGGTQNGCETNSCHNILLKITCEIELSHPTSVKCCHPERSEGSLSTGAEMLRFAQHDRTDLVRQNSLSWGIPYLSWDLAPRQQKISCTADHGYRFAFR